MSSFYNSKSNIYSVFIIYYWPLWNGLHLLSNLTWQQSKEVGSIIIFILQIKELRRKEVKTLTQGHTATRP